MRRPFDRRSRARLSGKPDIRGGAGAARRAGGPGNPSGFYRFRCTMLFIRIFDVIDQTHAPVSELTFGAKASNPTVRIPVNAISGKNASAIERPVIEPHVGQLNAKVETAHWRPDKI